ncbi:MAG: serine hydrolase [Saprospiraceae bacterium]|nr:serine hydrolase [Saprospiraceae bacterium]
MKHLILFIITLSPLTGFAQKSLPEDVVKSIKARIEYGHSPSIVVGIIDKYGPQYYLFGTKTEGGEPVNEHSIYEIGSITKTFTGILLASAKMNPNAPARKYLPAGVTLPSRNGKQITLGHLSDHTSALPRLPANLMPANPSNPYADYTVEQLYAFLKSCTLTRDIGSAYEYSNLAQGLLGHILALKAGKSFEALVVEKIALPLGMTSTKITFDDRMRQNLAIGHSDGEPAANWDIPTLAGAGAIRSSLHDMLLYVAANMGLKKSKLKRAMQMSHQPRHDKVGGGTRVGLGWHISKGAEGDVIWHNGGTGGYRTFAGFVKETGKGVVVLTNSTKGADDIGFHLLNSNAKLIEVKRSGAIALKKAADAKDAEAAWLTYLDLKGNQPDAYDFDEGELNALGYNYLQAGKVKEALTIFNVNVLEFPNSSNVYDSYGEALMKDGQKELAIENYNKSLELDPTNTNAISMLVTLGVKVPEAAVYVDPAILESYVGKYELSPGFFITITREGNRLFGQATGQVRFEMFAKSNDEFYLRVVEARITFASAGGKVVSLRWYQGVQELVGMKVE